MERFKETDKHFGFNGKLIVEVNGSDKKESENWLERKLQREPTIFILFSINLLPMMIYLHISLRHSSLYCGMASKWIFSIIMMLHGRQVLFSFFFFSWRKICIPLRITTNHTAYINRNIYGGVSKKLFLFPLHCLCLKYYFYSAYMHLELFIHM